MAWFAIMTKPRAEELADLDLRLRGIRTFFPHWLERVGRSKLEVKRGYFPNYIFVQDPGRFDLVTDADGVLYVCSFKDWQGNTHPFPIPDEVMAPIIALGDKDGRVRMEPPRRRSIFSVNKRVRFTEESNLFGFFGVVEEVMKGGKVLRVRLESSLLGKKSHVIDADKVTAA